MYRFRAKREQLELCRGLEPESQGQKFAWTVVYVRCSFGSGGGSWRVACEKKGGVRDISWPEHFWQVATFALDPDSTVDGLQPFHQKSTCLIPLTFRPVLVQIWSHYSLNLEETEPSRSTVWDPRLFLAPKVKGRAHPVQTYLTHKKQPPPLGSPQDPRYSPTVGS